MQVAIIDYLMGNVASVQKALNFLRVPSSITNDFTEIRKADYIILPGVGSFQQGMYNLEKLGLVEVLTEEVMHRKKPFLGACLGMQLIACTGYEPVQHPGLGWIKGEVVKIKSNGKRIPHLGWNNPTILKDTYFKNLTNPDFYFIHSYHFQIEEDDVVSSTVEYGETLVSSVEKDNIFATQFHPEKSQHAGLTVLKNFLDRYAKN
jgi:glutamine amidotransferase